MEAEAYNRFLQEAKDFEKKYGLGVIYLWKGEKRYARLS